MKIINYKKILIAFIVFGSSVSGYCQQYPDSLLHYLGIAARNNPAVLQKFIEYQASLQKIKQVGSLPDPELSAGVFLSPMELVSGNQVADFRLMQMFPWFGVLKNAKDEMSLMANAKFELFRDAKLQVFYDVQKSWYDLYKVQKEINISEKNIDILKIIERLALVRFKSAPSEGIGTSSSGSVMPTASAQINNTLTGMQTMGAGQGYSGLPSSGSSVKSDQSAVMGSSSASIGLSDIYRLQIEAGDLENYIALLKDQKRSILALFNSYLNRPPFSPVFTNEALTADSLDFSLEEVTDSILSKNPMLSMLEFEKKSIEARKKMVTRMGYPMVGLGLNYSLINKTKYPMGDPSMNGKDMVMPMVVLTLPVYRKKYNSMQKEAELLETATVQNYQATSNSLQVEFYQALLLYQDSRRRVNLYKNQYQLASSSFDLILKSFSTSSAGLADVLRGRQLTYDYELKQVEAVTDLNTSIAWLKRLMAFSQINQKLNENN